MRHQFTALTLLAGLAVQAGAQESLFKLTPSDGSPGADFGYAVSISGGRAIVGARAQTGAANLFDMQTGDRSQPRPTPGLFTWPRGGGLQASWYLGPDKGPRKH